MSSWTERDEILFSILNMFGKKYFEKKININTKQYLLSKQKPKLVATFGVYNIKKKLFTWQNGVNEMTYNLIKSGYMPVFGNIITIKKLCQPVIKINNKYLTENTIPYLIEIVNATFKVIRYRQGDYIIYSMIQIEKPSEKTPFNLNEFEASMMYYTMYNQLSKKQKTRKNRKTTHVQKTE